MARQGRLVLPGHAHLLSLPALPGLVPFADEPDREAFRSALREASAAEPVQLHAYALLRDEARLLVRPETAVALARWMQVIGRRYVSAYNRKYRRAGTLWSGRFRCAAIEPGSATLHALIYVDGAGGGTGDSSAAHRSGGAHVAALVDPAEYWALGNTPFDRERAYGQLLAEPAAPGLVDRLQRCLRGGWPYGSSAFLDRLAGPASRRVAPRPRGRPPAAR